MAHSYETGGLRRLHLRGHSNILKRVLIHEAGFNLGLVMRQRFGQGTPRGLQGRLRSLFCLLLARFRAHRLAFLTSPLQDWMAAPALDRWLLPRSAALLCGRNLTFTTGC